MSDQYKTIIGVAESRLEVKKSRFIGLATAIGDQDDTKGFLDLVKQKHANVSHYCYAYSVGAGDELREYATDAGEPTHSAGPPILTAVKVSGLSNVICVVVRYYGGVNLGVGGLIRAYGRCARECLGNAKIETRIFYQTLRLRASHDQIGPVVNLCGRLRGNILNVEYDEGAIVHLRIRQGELETFIAHLQGIGSAIEVTDVVTT